MGGGFVGGYVTQNAVLGKAGNKFFTSLTCFIFSFSRNVTFLFLFLCKVTEFGI